MSVQSTIEEKLRSGLSPTHLQIVNESHMHKTEPGACGCNAPEKHGGHVLGLQAAENVIAEAGCAHRSRERRHADGPDRGRSNARDDDWAGTGQKKGWRGDPATQFVTAVQGRSVA